MNAILFLALQTSDRFVFRRSSFLCHHWPLLLVFLEAARLLEKCLFFWKKKSDSLMTVLRFNSIFTPSLFLVVKLIQMAMFPYRYPDTIKLYVVPNLTMFR